MSQLSGSPQAAIDYNSTIIGALELSEKKWVLAVQLPGVDRHSRHVLDACGERFVSFIERLKARCASAGRKIARVILTHEAGRDGFWLARFLARRGIEGLGDIAEALRKGVAAGRSAGLRFGRGARHRMCFRAAARSHCATPADRAMMAYSSGLPSPR